MPVYLHDLLTSLLLYVFVGVACWGLGRAVARCLRIGMSRAERLFSPIWLGVAAVMLFLQVWHCFRPISWTAGVVGFGAGIALACPALYRAARQRWGRISRGGLACATLLLIIAIAAGTRAMFVPSTYDTGLYHLPMIRWLNEYPIVPGLGNLYTSLAYNQSSFLFVAALNFYPFGNHGHNVAASFLFLLAVGECLRLLFAAWPGRPGREKEMSYKALLALLLLPVLGIAVGLSSLSSPSPDIVADLLEFAIFLRLAGIVCDRIGSRAAISQSAVILVLASLAVTVKLSTAAYAGLAALIALSACLFRHTASWRQLFRGVERAMVWSFAALAVWVLRGIVWSGYPAFPSPFMRLNFDWAVPLDRARLCKDTILGWSRMGNEHWREALGNWNWVVPHLQALCRNGWAMAACLGWIVSAVWLLRLPPIRRRETLPYFLAVIPPLGGLVFWFMTAPDIRFAKALFCILLLAAVSPCLAGMQGRLRYRAAWAGFVSLCIAGVLLGAEFLASKPGRIAAVVSRGYAEWPPTPLLTLRTTRYGARVFVAVNGEEQIWDAPLPATPELDPGLCLRGSDLRSGFCIRSDEPRRK